VAADEGDVGPPLPEEVAERVRALSRASVALHAAVGAALGLTATDLAAIDHLLADGPLTQEALRARLRLQPSSTTALVDRLERAGHARRAPHPESRRAVLVTATDRAHQLAQQGRDALARSLTALAEHYDGHEREVIASFLTQAAALMAEHATTMATLNRTRPQQPGTKA
jgi:DNA-binding MarR family transcriptional regulator